MQLAAEHMAEMKPQVKCLNAHHTFVHETVLKG
jgi:hypothetical protein